MIGDAAIDVIVPERDVIPPRARDLRQRDLHRRPIGGGARWDDARHLTMHHEHVAPDGRIGRELDGPRREIWDREHSTVPLRERDAYRLPVGDDAPIGALEES